MYIFFIFKNIICVIVSTIILIQTYEENEDLIYHASIRKFHNFLPYHFSNGNKDYTKKNR